MVASTRAPAQAGAGREWINRATLTGLVLVIGALALIRRTEATADEVGRIFGMVLLGVGLLRIFLYRSGRRFSLRNLGPALLMVGGGVALLYMRITSITVLGQVVGLLLATAGVLKLIRAFTLRRDQGSTSGAGALAPDVPEASPALPAPGPSDPGRAAGADGDDRTAGTSDLDDPEDAADAAILARVLRPKNVLLVEAGLLIASALVLMLVPAIMLSLLILVGAFVALGMGLILIAFGVRPDTRAEAAGIDAMAMPGVVRRWALDRDIGPTRRDEVADALFYEGPHKQARRTSFAILMVLSTLIATFGVIQDSTAVVIGAMLVAPLMTPILGVAAGIIGAWPRRTATSLATVAVGALLAVGVAVLASSWIPDTFTLESNSQINSRVTPTLLDLAIAVAAGAAGAYANIDKRVSSSLTGVAIAVALVPPLAVVGVTLHTGDWNSSRGAGLLFATNAVAIVLTGSLVFLLAGFSSAARLRRYQDALRTSLLSVLMLGLVIVIPLSLAGQALVTVTVQDERVESAINAWIPDEPGWSLLSWDLDDDILRVTVAGPTAAPPLSALDATVEEATLRDTTVVLSLIRSETTTS